MRESRSGILLVSPTYITKKWTQYEADTIHRFNIEQDKKILQVWHKITKSEIEAWNPGLTGIVAINSNTGLAHVVEKLSDALASGVPARGVAPCWESPYIRFFKGYGELHFNHEGGPVFTLWECLLMGESNFPIWIDGQAYSRKDFLCHAAIVLAHNPDAAKQWSGIAPIEKLRQICIDGGFNPESYA